MKDEFRAVENMKTTLIDLAILKRVVLIFERKKERKKPISLYANSYLLYQKHSIMMFE